MGSGQPWSPAACRLVLLLLRGSKMGKGLLIEEGGRRNTRFCVTQISTFLLGFKALGGGEKKEHKGKRCFQKQSYFTLIKNTKNVSAPLKCLLVCSSPRAKQPGSSSAALQDVGTDPNLCLPIAEHPPSTAPGLGMLYGTQTPSSPRGGALFSLLVLSSSFYYYYYNY